MVLKIQVESSQDLFKVLESFGDFLLLKKNQYIIHTDSTKTKLKNKIKSKIGKDSEMMITEISIDEVALYPDIVKSWLLQEQLKQKIANLSIDDVKSEALNRLNIFIDSLEQELENSTEGRV